MVTKVFQLILLISPIAVAADISMDMFDIVFFRTSVIVLFIAFLMDTPKRAMPKYVDKCAFSLLGLSLINLFIHDFAPVVLHTQMNLFLAVLAMYIVYVHLDKKNSIRKYILFAALINLAYYLCQKAGFNPIYDIMPYKGQEGAFLGNQPRLMTYFALVTPFLWTPLLLVSLALGLYTKQIIIFIPIAIAIFARAKSQRERIGIVILIILTMILLRDKIFAALSFRFNMSYKPVLTAFFDRPLIGFGLGARVIPELEVVGNSYLQLIIGVGLLGAVWFGYVFKNIWQKIRHNSESVALLSLAIIMMFEYPIEIMRLGYLIIAIIVNFILKGEKYEKTA